MSFYLYFNTSCLPSYFSFDLKVTDIRSCHMLVHTHIHTSHTYPPIHTCFLPGACQTVALSCVYLFVSHVSQQSQTLVSACRTAFLNLNRNTSEMINMAQQLWQHSVVVNRHAPTRPPVTDGVLTGLKVSFKTVMSVTCHLKYFRARSSVLNSREECQESIVCSRIVRRERSKNLRFLRGNHGCGTTPLHISHWGFSPYHKHGHKQIIM